MIWSEDIDSKYIRLIPTNKKYTDYLFHIDTSVCSLEVATYVIWRYFTSSLCNKRQGFQPTEIFKIFGIKRVTK